MGYVYRPKYRDRQDEVKESRVYWCQYYANGRPVRESTGETMITKAEKFLKRQEGKIAEGKPVTVNANRIKFSELTQAVVYDYKENEHATLSDVETRLRLHILPVFGHRNAASISPPDILAYRTARKDAGAANATINRELSIIQRAYTLAIRNGLLYYAPAIVKLKENNVRKGFFEVEQFRAMLGHLPEDVQPVALFGNITGWRRGEVLKLEWRNVDFRGGSVRLDVGTTKNDEGREFPLTDDLRELLERQRARTEEVQRKTGTIVPFVFHRNGRRIKDFRGAWKEACQKAGVPGMHFHDLRRTAVRRSTRSAGLHQKLAMALSGHKTDSVFRRYDIIAKSDLSVAASALNQAARIEAADKDADKDGSVKKVASKLSH